MGELSKVTRRDCVVACGKSGGDRVHGNPAGTGVSTLELGGSGPAQKRLPPLRQVLACLSSTFASKRANVSEFSSSQVRPWQAAPENSRSETRKNAESVGVLGVSRAVGAGIYTRGETPAISRVVPSAPRQPPRLKAEALAAHSSLDFFLVFVSSQPLTILSAHLFGAPIRTSQLSNDENRRELATAPNPNASLHTRHPRYHSAIFPGPAFHGGAPFSLFARKIRHRRSDPRVSPSDRKLQWSRPSTRPRIPRQGLPPCAMQHGPGIQCCPVSIQLIQITCIHVPRPLHAVARFGLTCWSWIQPPDIDHPFSSIDTLMPACTALAPTMYRSTE